MSDAVWKKCSSCRNPLSFNADHWVCNVSTCNRPRTFLAFCSVSCWDAHLAMIRHRESWAEERKGPSEALWAKVLAGEENWPPRAPKAVEEAPPAAKVSSGPKVIRRKPQG